MFADKRSRPSADVSAPSDTAQLPWLASMPSTASELVCVGKIKSNGVSQSLFIDRSEWPPKTIQHNSDGQKARPHQTRAAAVVAAAAVAAAAAPKVICISPVTQPRRSHTVIRRAVTSTYPHHHQQQSKDVASDQQKTGASEEVPVVEVVSTVGCVQNTADASAIMPRPTTTTTTTKRTFEQRQTADVHDSRQLRVQLRSVADARAKSARITDCDAVVAPTSSSKVLPGSSVLLSRSASKGSSSAADGRPQLRSLLPRSTDMPPTASGLANVITIMPATSSVPMPAASSVMIPPHDRSPSLIAAVANVISSGAASSPATANRIQTTGVASSSPTLTATCTADAVECLNRSSAEPTLAVPVQNNSAAGYRNQPGVGSRSQFLQRVRLIECEMTTAHRAPKFCINVVPMQATSDDKPPALCPATAAAATSADCKTDAARDDDGDNDDDDDDDDVEQPPAQMLEALQLVRNPSQTSRRTRRRDITVTSSSPASISQSRQASAPAAAAAASAAARLVRMKLVNRSTQ